MDILQIEGVTKQFTAHLALDNVSLSIPRGSVYGLLGPNGAGKSTLIKIINRITAPDSGRVLFDGRELEPNDIYRIGYLPEERGLKSKPRPDTIPPFLWPLPNITLCLILSQLLTLQTL